MISNHNRMINKLFPKWAKILDMITKGQKEKADVYLNKYELSMMTSNRCIMGEIRNHKPYEWFSNNYCSECDRLAFDELVMLYNGVVERKITNWRTSPIIIETLNHIQNKHGELLQ